MARKHFAIAISKGGGGGFSNILASSLLFTRPGVLLARLMFAFRKFLYDRNYYARSRVVKVGFLMV
jgi:hypothetical protein